MPRVVNGIVNLYVIACSASGKRYVGLTVKPVSKRWVDHCWQSKKSNAPLHRAIRKYGADKFEVMHIASARSWSDGCIVEKALIIQEGTFFYGYNATLGGDGTAGYIPPADVRAKRSAKLKGRTFSAEHLQKIATANSSMWTPERRAAASDRQKKLFCDPQHLAKLLSRRKEMGAVYTDKIAAARRGKKQSPQTLAKLSAIRKGRVLTAAHRGKISAGLNKFYGNEKVISGIWEIGDA